MSELVLQRCTDQALWDQFLRRSPQACRYSTEPVLHALACKADFWFVKRKGQVIAGLPVITENQAADGLPIHSYYVGLMLHDEAWRCKPNRRTENLLAITEQLMRELSTHYDVIELCLHPDITDIRGFDWFNYHEPQAGRVAIHARYSAQLSLDKEHIRHAARSSRRREEKYAREREQLHFVSGGTSDELLRLWQHSLQRQDCTIPTAELDATRVFAEHLLATETGTIATVRNQDDEAVAAGLLMYDYHGLVHLPVVGIADTRYGGTLLYFSMMEVAAEKGYTRMDLNGANSPARGYFKHSIGGEATLYFHLRWDRPS